MPLRSGCGLRYAPGQAVTAMGRRCRCQSCFEPALLQGPSSKPISSRPPSPDSRGFNLIHLSLPSHGRPPQVGVSSPGRSVLFSGSLLLVGHCLGQVSKRGTYWVHTCCREMDMHTSSHRSTLRSCTICHPSTHPPTLRPSFICSVQKHSHVYPPLPWDAPFSPLPRSLGSQTDTRCLSR